MNNDVLLSYEIPDRLLLIEASTLTHKATELITKAKQLITGERQSLNRSREIDASFDIANSYLNCVRTILINTPVLHPYVHNWLLKTTLLLNAVIYTKHYI
jgi:hypothetical protein